MSAPISEGDKSSTNKSYCKILEYQNITELLKVKQTPEAYGPQEELSSNSEMVSDFGEEVNAEDKRKKCKILENGKYGGRWLPEEHS